MRLTMHEKTVLVIGGVAIALVIVGIWLRSLPVEWSRRLGALLPGWPWW
jgi:hypothetical protein